MSKGMFPVPGSFNRGIVTGAAFWFRLLRGPLEDEDAEDEAAAAAVMEVLAIVVAVVEVDIIVLVPVRVPVPVPPTVLGGLRPIDTKESEDGRRFNPVLVTE